MPTKEFFDQEREAASILAREWLDDPDLVILDGETTSLNNAEFVELAIIDYQGNTLFDARILPEYPNNVYKRDGRSKKCAFDIHGIAPEDLEGCPTFPEVHESIREILKGKRLVIYNADFDWTIYKNLCMHFRLLYPTVRSVECAMKTHARWFGEWSDYRESFRWQPLEGGDHSALGDCVATLDRIREMAGEAG